MAKRRVARKPLQKGRPKGEGERALVARERAARRKDVAAKPKLPPKRSLWSQKRRREAERKRRAKQVGEQIHERQKRSRKKGYGKLALPRVEKTRFTQNGRVYEKTVRRYRGVKSLDQVNTDLFNLPYQKKTRAWVQLGPGYSDKSKWVGSRVDTPRQTSLWLQSYGLTYTKTMKEPSRLYVESVTIRRLPEKRKNAPREKSRKSRLGNKRLARGARQSKRAGAARRGGGGKRSAR